MFLCLFEKTFLSPRRMGAQTVRSLFFSIELIFLVQIQYWTGNLDQPHIHELCFTLSNSFDVIK